MGGVARSEPLVLVVDDEATVRQALERALRLEGFAVSTAAGGRAALEEVAARPPAVVVLDVMMPGLDGVSVVRKLRGDGIDVPVCMLSARDEVEDRVAGLQAGADDYLVKPFAFSELLARIQALLRRGRPAQTPSESTVLKLGDLELDLIRRKAVRAGKRLELTAKEFNLLSLLLRRAGEVLSRTELAEQVWDMNFDSETNVVEVAVRRLRTKLDQPFERPLLHTVRGMGYVLEAREP